MWIADNWKDYELLDASRGKRLERWGKYTLIRPDPQVIWSGDEERPEWKHADAVYTRNSSGGGEWNRNKLPESWNVGYDKLTFGIKTMGFKHTGLFPEQAANWDFTSELIKKANRPIKVLNLFAYTGGATVAAAAAGASVCHVDAAKGMVNQAKENLRLSGLSDRPVRFIVDDCKKFTEREIRRGSKYDGIIMDPPSYGRGPNGEVWKLEDCVEDLVKLCAEVMSDKPLFFILNSYTTGLSPAAMKNITELCIAKRFGGKTEADELALPIKSNGLYLPCGSSVRWSKI